MNNSHKTDFTLEKLKTDYRRGDLIKLCDACEREIELYEKVFQFGGKICENCYQDVNKGLNNN